MQNKALREGRVSVLLAGSYRFIWAGPKVASGGKAASGRKVGRMCI
jgi:hypothetical protein